MMERKRHAAMAGGLDLLLTPPLPTCVIISTPIRLPRPHSTARSVYANNETHVTGPPVYRDAVGGQWAMCLPDKVLSELRPQF